jgi:translation initiation factor 6
VTSRECDLMLRLGAIDGNPYIGVFCAASDRLAIVHGAAEPSLAKSLGEALDVPVITTFIAGSTVVGSLVAMNSNGAVVTNFAETDELARLPSSLRVGRMEKRLNAAGNNILVSDRAAIVHPRASRDTVAMIRDVLGVEVERRSVAGVETVGSVCLVTSKGLLCHPRTAEEELRWLSEFFRAPASITTLNYGNPYLGACAAANSKGAFVGSRTTPIELGRLEDGLMLF